MDIPLKRYKVCAEIDDAAEEDNGVAIWFEEKPDGAWCIAEDVRSFLAVRIHRLKKHFNLDTKEIFDILDGTKETI